MQDSQFTKLSSPTVPLTQSTGSSHGMRNEIGEGKGAL
jgi:hypothetical protein